MRQRRLEAENRPLFASHDPLVLTIKADFKAVNKEQDGEQRHALSGHDLGRRRFGRADSGRARLARALPAPVRAAARGCRFASSSRRRTSPGTVFDGQSSLKLVTHCRDNNDFEQHVLREYVPYRIYGLLSPIAFRARLAKIAYVDAASGKPLTTRYGMFIEDDSDVARRAEARSIDLPRTLFKDLDADSLTTMALFEYMIANTDVSIIKLHNVKLMVTEQRDIYPVPYDFDFSGLVDTPYANPDPKLGIATVRDRHLSRPVPDRKPSSSRCSRSSARRRPR